MDADNNKQTEEALSEFVVQMMSEKGVDSQAEDYEEKKNELIEKLKKEVTDATIDALPDDKAIALSELVEEKGDALSEEEIKKYFTEAQDEINISVKKTMEEFREKYLREDA